MSQNELSAKIRELRELKRLQEELAGYCGTVHENKHQPRFVLA